MKSLTLFLALSFVGMIAQGAPEQDAAFSRQLVGTWESDPANRSPVVTSITFAADGTGVEVVHLRNQSMEKGVRLTISWSVVKGILSVKAISSSNPRQIPHGDETKDRIVSVSEDRYVYKTVTPKASDKPEVLLRKK